MLTDSSLIQASLQDFIATPLCDVIHRAETSDADQQALAFARQVIQTVPAYRKFLEAFSVDLASLDSPEAFSRLPLLTKENYIKAYPLAERLKGGCLAACDMVAMSSGSTGESTVWLRSIADELSVVRRFEQVLVEMFAADKTPTLAVVCFALGTWVGGMYTASCLRHLALKGYPLMVVTPGNNRAEIFRVIRELGPQFEQVVLLGYPPFLKDVIDAGRHEGLDWSPYRIKLVTAGEVFSEDWRALMAERVGAADSLNFAASLYGTADAGVLGNETPLSIVIRRFLAANPNAASALFGQSRLPSLMQYDPTLRYFEVTPEGTLLFTGDNGVPLVRYHIADEGGLMTYEAMLAFCQSHGFDPLSVLAQAGQSPLARLPFVWVFGRSHFVVSFFGANIYPENIAVALEQTQIAPWVTGKFILSVDSDVDENRHLSLSVELAPGEVASETRAQCIQQTVVETLRRLNSEFTHYVPETYQTPCVVLKAAGDPEDFPPGVKHRYTRPSVA